jgi:hypothetical protein
MVILLIDEIQNRGYIDHVVVVGDMIRQWRKSLKADSIPVSDVLPNVETLDPLLWAVIREIAQAEYASVVDNRSEDPIFVPGSFDTGTP